MARHLILFHVVGEGKVGSIPPPCRSTWGGTSSDHSIAFLSTGNQIHPAHRFHRPHSCNTRNSSAKISCIQQQWRKQPRAPMVRLTTKHHEICRAKNISIGSNLYNPSHRVALITEQSCTVSSLTDIPFLYNPHGLQPPPGELYM